MHKSKFRKFLAARGITKEQIKNISGWSDRTIERIHAGMRLLSNLEIRGLSTVEICPWCEGSGRLDLLGTRQSCDKCKGKGIKPL